MYPDNDDMQRIASSGASVATVLVVEDEVLIRLAITDHLRDCGFRVFEAASAQEAQAIFLAGADIDLVFSDVHMPAAGDGIRLALWIAEHRPDVSVMLTSGVEASLKAAETTCSNVKALVSKPYQYETLTPRIRDLLQARASK
jgi:CheY-like chemotaxis protein